MLTIYSLVLQNDPRLDHEPDVMHILKTGQRELDKFYEPVLIFDDATTPPTLVRNEFPASFLPSNPPTQARSSDARLFWHWFKKENHQLPRLYIDEKGNIMRRYMNTVRPVMEGPAT